MPLNYVWSKNVCDLLGIFSIYAVTNNIHEQVLIAALSPQSQPPDQLEQQMILQAKAGDQGAMQWLYQQYSQRVYNLALHLLCHQADAQDVMQDAFVKCFKSLHQYRGEASFWSWLRRIVSTTTFMRMRRDKRRGQEFDVDGVVGEAVLISASDATQGAVQVELEAALAQLPVLSRTVIWLYHVEGYTHLEIAEMMGRSTSFSKSRLTRARRQLRMLLAVDEEPASVSSNSKNSQLSSTTGVACSSPLATTLYEVN